MATYYVQKPGLRLFNKAYQAGDALDLDVVPINHRKFTALVNAGWLSKDKPTAAEITEAKAENPAAAEAADRAQAEAEKTPEGTSPDSAATGTSGNPTQAKVTHAGGGMYTVEIPGRDPTRIKGLKAAHDWAISQGAVVAPEAE